MFRPISETNWASLIENYLDTLNPFTPVPDKAHRAAIDQLVRDAAQ
jgi:hypothetical protein